MSTARVRVRPTARVSRGLLGAMLALAVAAEAGAAGPPPLPEAGSDIHLGVVSCAGSTCHGAAEPLKDSNVLQNEFITWHRQDSHAKAYKVLLEKDGQRIARNLGLQDAASAPECLACHADYVPQEKRGKRHQMSDGVGCEACHGGGSRYLGPHVAGAVGGVPLERLHAENNALGMYPTADPVSRARLCLSCHLGTGSKFATHRIMGAGHPRISFELDTFTALQPAHYRVDEDYRVRKAVYSGVQVWAVGQVMAASDFIDLYLSAKWKGEGIWPELAFFDCHACHHPMSNPRWNARESVRLPPGVPRLNDSNMLMLAHLTRHMDPDLAARLREASLALHKGTLAGAEATREAAGELRAVLGQIQDRALARSFGPADIRAMLASLAADGAAGEYNDYAGAEQAVMALASLVDALRAAGDLEAALKGRLEAEIKRLYEVLKDENTYRPEQLVASMKTVQAALN